MEIRLKKNIENSKDSVFHPASYYYVKEGGTDFGHITRRHMSYSLNS